MFKRANLILIIILLLGGFALRFINLGYSDYQGDEIKAFFNPKEDGDYIQFLLDQRKGPNQFLVTGAIKGFTDNFENYFLTRLPFALAGILSIYVFYLVVKRLFNERMALISTIFFATNGFLIAFSRIVQYQSFVILLGLLAIHLYLKYREKKSIYLIYLSFFSLAISILFHYDGVFFGLPILIFFIQDFLKARKEKQRNFFLHAGGAISLFLVTLMVFYIPFVLNISSKTLDYWGGRITGEVSDKISSSYYLFTVYQPIYSIHFYTLLSTLGILFIFYPLIFKLFKKYLFKLKLQTEINKDILVVFLWAIIPFIFLEGVVYIPGTHIYTYLIPVFIIMAYGIEKLLELNLFKYFEKITYAGLGVLTIFLFLQSYTIFVDHKSGEYPWQDKKFLFFTLNQPTARYHLSLFGFPYFRNWQEVRNSINGDNSIWYTTNERVSISRYFVNLPKNGDKIGYYVYIERPQSLTENITNSRTQKWKAKGNKPIKIIENPSGNRTLIFRLPESFESEKAQKASSTYIENNGNEEGN
jgi:hypothetical protein